MDTGVPNLTIHENGLLKPRQKTEKGPSADLRLGDEGAPDQRPQNNDIQVRGMVGNDQRRPAAGRLPDHFDIQPDGSHEMGGAG